MARNVQPPSKKRKVNDIAGPSNASSASTVRIMEEEPSSTSGDGEASLLHLTPFEQRVLKLAKNFPKGLSNKIINGDSPDIGGEDRAKAINNLLSLGYLELYKQGNELLYKYKTQSASGSKSHTSGQLELKDADREEKVIYDIIATSGNKGIWIRDIRFKSNLTMPQLNKVLKSLESKRLIKTVKSVAAAKKKVFMLYELEPDRSVTGGSFYSDQDFEVEFVSVLNQQCLRYLENKKDSAKRKRGEHGLLMSNRMATATLEEIHLFIKNLGISKVELSLSDIESILETLIYDNRIDCLSGDGAGKVYRSRPGFGSMVTMDAFPCGICPVAKDCSEHGTINPSSCLYLTNWLNSEQMQF